MFMLILVCQGSFFTFLKDEIIKPEEEEEGKKKTTKATKGKKGLKVKVSLCFRFSRKWECYVGLLMPFTYLLGKGGRTAEKSFDSGGWYGKPSYGGWNLFLKDFY